MISLDAVRYCLESSIPPAIATCAPDGTPNVTPLSQIEYVDSDHVALSFQFFNKTRNNVLANPFAEVMLVDDRTATIYYLSAEYLRTETAGPVFERMKAKLAGIASHTGMSGIFRLQGSDIYRVTRIERADSLRLPEPATRPSRMSATRSCCARLASATDLAGALDHLLADLHTHLAVDHAQVLMLDSSGTRLYTVASRGYETSGVGSEIPIGQGVIGVAARERTPIRIFHVTAEYAYVRSVRYVTERVGRAGDIETEIPLPGLAMPGSQMAVPIMAGADLLGVLFAESQDDLRFTYDDEDALATIATQLGMTMRLLGDTSGAGDEAPAPEAKAAVAGQPVTIRHYRVDDSVFIDQDYLIKGVAGAIMWKLVSDFVERGRSEFTNRELRLDPAIGLPSVSENLEARLILLQRRLGERCSFIRIEKTGRGRFRLVADRPRNPLVI